MVTTPVTFPAVSHKDLRAIQRVTIQNLHRPGSNPQKCGKTRRELNVGVWIKDGSAWFRGLVNCGQVWVCPVCAYRIARQRSKEVLAVIRAHRKKGGGIYLVTATLPHDQGDDLRRLRGVVSRSWSACISGRGWPAMKKAIGLEGQVRALEVTHGPSGWHPHLHVLLFTRHTLSEAQAASLRDFLFQRWCDAIEAAGCRRPSPEHGLVLSHGESAGSYVTKITKQGLAQEIGRADLKAARGGSRSISHIIDDYARYERVSDEVLLGKWIDGMRGARQLTWSNGFRRRYLLAEQLDFDLVLDRVRPGARLLAEIPGPQWDCLARADSSLPRRLLAAAEKSGRPGIDGVLLAACAQLPACPAAPPRDPPPGRRSRRRSPWRWWSASGR